MKTVRIQLGVALTAVALLSCACVQAQQAPPKIVEIIVRSELKVDETGLIRVSRVRPRQEATKERLQDALRNVLAAGVLAEEDPPNGLAPGVRLFMEPVRGGVRLMIEVTKSAIVRRIIVENAGPVPAQEILRILLTKPGKPALLRDVRRDVQAIQEFYQRNGYIANVTPGIGISEGVLIIPISVTRISRIDFEISGPIAERELREALAVKVGDYYNTNSLRRAYTGLWNHIERKGLTGDIQPGIRTPVPGQAEITLNVEVRPKDGSALTPVAQVDDKKIVEIGVKGNRNLNNAFILAMSGLKVGDVARACYELVM
jgi:outer membrane protein assembly factor BamA